MNGDPAAHLPEKARGVLGAITPDIVARMKEYIRLILSRFDKR
jgi:hypothetical protein